MKTTNSVIELLKSKASFQSLNIRLRHKQKQEELQESVQESTKESVQERVKEEKQNMMYRIVTHSINDSQSTIFTPYTYISTINAMDKEANKGVNKGVKNILIHKFFDYYTRSVVFTMYSTI